ncbi:hypothetical protein WJX72_004760 [[Myrmecia] bisecta]|uniref:Integral membrane bound transporter domain-containing protein n=1 Tax=[Myrmecia] bisecta TaxID=41462 RepID=A0AAW1Q523_9CHLO
MADSGKHVALEVQAPSIGGAPHKEEAQKVEVVRVGFPWRPGPVDKLRAIMVSPLTQAALQLAAGQFVVCLFVFVRHISFSNSCLASIFYIASMLLLSLDTTVGSRLLAAASINGSLWVGVMSAGAMVSLAHAPGVAYTTFLCVFSCLALVVFCALRAAAPLGTGIIANLGFGITIVTAQFSWPGHTLWYTVIVHFLEMGLVAGLGTAFAGLFIFPTLARDELRDCVAQIVSELGSSISGMGSSGGAAAMDADLKRQRSQRALQIHMCAREEDQHDTDYRYSAGWSQNTDTRASRVDTALSAGTSASRIGGIKDELCTSLDRQFIRDASDPRGDHDPRHAESPWAPSASTLRPQLLLARRLLSEAQAEPQFLSAYLMQLGDWAGVLDALSSLITKSAALESVLEGEEPLLQDRALRQLLGRDVLPVFRLLYAQLAASCAAIAKAVRSDKGSKRAGQYALLFGPSWGVLEFELAATLHAALKGYWQQYRVTHPGDLYRPAPQVRALLYVATLTNGIMESMAGLEHAVMVALSKQMTVFPLPHQRQDIRARLTSLDQRRLRDRISLPVQSALKVVRSHGQLPTDTTPSPRPPWDASGDDQDTVARPSEAAPAPADDGSEGSRILDEIKLALDERSRSLASLSWSQSEAPRSPRPKAGGQVSLKRLMAERPLQQRSSQALQRHADDSALTPRSHTGPDGERPAGWWPWLWLEVAWLLPLVEGMLAFPVWTTLRTLLTQRIPEALSSRGKLAENTWRNRYFVFGLKFWVGYCIVLCLSVALSANHAAVRAWRPLYAILTVVVVLSEKIDLTVTRGVLRLAGSVLGGVLGFLVMLRPSVATSPYALTAIVCTFTCLCGFLTMTQFKYAVFLTLVTADALILCQYTGRPGSHGTPQYFYARVAMVSGGVVVVYLIDLIMPWYASSAALEQMGAAYAAATKLIQRDYEVFHDELERVGRPCNPGDAEKAEAAEKQDLEQTEKDILHKCIAAPLSAVQASLAREAVLWKHGILAMPKIVHDMLRCMLVLLDRLAAVELMLQQKPIVSGRYSAAPFKHLLEPIDKRLRAVLAAVVELGEAVKQVLSADKTQPALLELVADKIKALEHARMLLRLKYLETQRTLHDACQETYLHDRTPDDAIRFLSTIFALSKAIDKATLVARTVLEDEWMQQRSNWRLLLGIQP